ncbi:hypothetical protein G4G27_14365 [Sphingomonas sp. So64.6b]|uniref:hypothetical protein n=1 Tax=Sphingomonas sp. So64.6b TaxID=2997354 RepID=UPI0016033E4A|nr:hypothetical protein [Sphingomonas sp. So64.6b]QNA85047.1 hypothetical protein G4G27_14365 [Sphingomonas sp. So64.6b]
MVNAVITVTRATTAYLALPTGGDANKGVIARVTEREPRVTERERPKLTEWADECLRINHLDTLVQREIKAGTLIRAADPSERARVAAWRLFNEMMSSFEVKTLSLSPSGAVNPGVILMPQQGGGRAS